VALALYERADPTVTKVDANVKVAVVDYEQEALAQLKALKALGVAREKLEEMFGFSGLPVLEAQLEEQNMRNAKVIEARAIEVEKPLDIDPELAELLR
jgi:hypothetical protein